MGFVLLGVDATLGDGCRIREHLKWNEDAGSVQNFIFWFCVWCKSRELGGRVSRKFPCVTTVMESFSFDLLQTIISCWTESHLESCQISTMELFCKNSLRPKHNVYWGITSPQKSPTLYCFFVNPSLKYQIFQWTPKSFSSSTPSYLLKVTKFFFKTLQFEFLVMTEKNIFIYQLFLWLNISNFSLFFM